MLAWGLSFRSSIDADLAGYRILLAIRPISVSKVGGAGDHFATGREVGLLVSAHRAIDLLQLPNGALLFRRQLPGSRLDALLLEVLATAAARTGGLCGGLTVVNFRRLLGPAAARKVASSCSRWATS